MPINMTDIADTVTYPLKYRGASICCQTSSGSQIWRRYAISFMAAIVMARSSLSLPQTSLAQLCVLLGLFFKGRFGGIRKTHAMHSPLRPKDAPAEMRHVHFHQVGISQIANDT